MAATMPREVQGRSQERSLVGLFSDLWRETATLLRDEAELAKAEITEKVTQVQTAAVELAAGALVLYAGFLVLLAAAAMGLAQVLPEEMAPWLAPLIIGVVVSAAGVVLLLVGRNKVKAGSLTPERTMHSLRKDAALAKGHVR
ncbi:MAG TPA: phage holin family protein [Burkholderiales bacterium]|nr:phage holin family protein [Burkholderiales bacterium]